MTTPPADNFKQWSIPPESSAAQAIDAALARIGQHDSAVHAFLDVWSHDARRRAAEIDARRAHGDDAEPLAGMPIAVKDNICTRNGRTTCASRILENYRSPFDAHVIERLEAAGAVIVGKTNLDEFAMGSSTEHSAFGPTRNPWNPACVPGGSSGGSAAAVAARMVPAALGSDTGGSIRQPAAFCGVTGLKPTYGRVSRYGLVAFGSSLDQIGPLAADARGVAAILRAIAGRDPRDSTSVEEPVPDYVAELDKPLAPKRIGIPREYFGAGLDGEVRAAVEEAVAVFERLGARRVEVSLPHTDDSLPVYYLISSAEASSNLARFDGVHYGHRTAHPADYIDVYSGSREEGFGAEVKRRIMLGTYALSSGYYDAYYLKALKVRTLIRDEFLRAFEACDLLACPTSPFPPFRLGERTEDPLSMYLADAYTFGANLAGVPAISLPCGFTASGLPIGLQLMGPHFSEARLLRAAHAYQRETDWHTRVPPGMA
ncbi:MAG: Asp-tRNA(Asn)/Glu-tRNA(Gln) amidotransferase subunit GatA [Phycisphaerae bacterium]|nr:Asp-tRNA(Asn)/Glu-tRNA(Gln) amidotransferase subunit GatA [Phycisphaerae bacterium]